MSIGRASSTIRDPDGLHRLPVSADAR